MSIEIHPLRKIEEYRAAEDIQRIAWNLADARLTPDHILLTAQKNGGVVLGAFEVVQEEAERHLIGFVYGFVGLGPDGKIKHCSHQLGVLPEYQNQNIGYCLKLAQRERVLAQGIDLITWTYDPLESRNAYLNLRKLGAVCNTYLRNVYGEMRDTLNAGLPSDRFQVDWHIASSHVANQLHGYHPHPTPSELRAAGVPVLNSTLAEHLPNAARFTLASEQVLIQIPYNFQRLKKEHLELARTWREETRLLFERAFAQGYTAVDLLVEEKQSYYLLQKNWRAH